MAAGAPFDDDGGGAHGAVWVLLLDDGSCPWDLDASGDVGVKDLPILRAAWGPNPRHPADFNDNGSVGASDLLGLLANWG